MPATSPPGFGLGVEITCRVYRPRDPRKAPLYGILESLYERVKAAWEERFERTHGFWRGLVDQVLAAYRACREPPTPWALLFPDSPSPAAQEGDGSVQFP